MAGRLHDNARLNGLNDDGEKIPMERIPSGRHLPRYSKHLALWLNMTAAGKMLPRTPAARAAKL